jgi:hypothetical protein
MRIHRIFRVLAASLLAAFASTAFAKNLTVTIPMQSVDARSGERGDYYVVNFDLPSDLAGKRLDSVFLDFVVDVSPTNEAVADATPLVGVFPLTETLTGANLKYESDVSSVRPVSLGESQKVRVDVTDVVKGWLANPSRNHGVVIGSLTGPSVGAVSLSDTALGPSVALRVTFFYQNRSGERVSTK